MTKTRLAKSSMLTIGAALMVAAGAAATAGSCGKKSDSGNASKGGGNGNGTPTPGAGASGGTLETKFASSSLNIKGARLADDDASFPLQSGATPAPSPTPTSTTTGTGTNGNGAPAFDPANLFGQSGIEGYKSAKFRVSGITLCQEVAEERGDACGKGPWTIFNEGQSSPQEYDEFVPSKALGFDKWIDFLDPSSTAQLGKKATYGSGQVGEYAAVIVNFYRTFKIKAEVKMNDGKTLYTKASTDFRSNGKPGLDVTYANAAKNLTTAPAEDAVMFLPNGGKTFYLQSKFAITADDVAKKTPFKMVLAYDPVNAIKGSATDPAGAFTNGWVEGQIDVDTGYKIQAPFLEFTPVLARANETILKETYLLSTPGAVVFPGEPANPLSVRLTIYYVKEDASSSVRGATTALVYNAQTKRYMNFNPLGSIRRVTAAAGGGLDFGPNSAVKALAGFKRLDKEGDTGAVSGTICAGGITSTGCEAGKDVKFDWTYTLVGRAEVSEAIAVEAEQPLPTVAPSAAPGVSPSPSANVTPVVTPTP